MSFTDAFHKSFEENLSFGDMWGGAKENIIQEKKDELQKKIDEQKAAAGAAKTLGEIDNLATELSDPYADFHVTEDSSLKNALIKSKLEQMQKLAESQNIDPQFVENLKLISRGKAETFKLVRHKIAELLKQKKTPTEIIQYFSGQPAELISGLISNIKEQRQGGAKAAKESSELRVLQATEGNQIKQSGVNLQQSQLDLETSKATQSAKIKKTNADARSAVVGANVAEATQAGNIHEANTRAFHGNLTPNQVQAAKLLGFDTSQPWNEKKVLAVQHVAQQMDNEAAASKSATTSVATTAALDAYKAGKPLSLKETGSYAFGWTKSMIPPEEFERLGIDPNNPTAGDMKKLGYTSIPTPKELAAYREGLPHLSRGIKLIDGIRGQLEKFSSPALSVPGTAHHWLNNLGSIATGVVESFGLKEDPKNVAAQKALAEGGDKRVTKWIDNELSNFQGTAAARQQIKTGLTELAFLIGRVLGKEGRAISDNIFDKVFAPMTGLNIADPQVLSHILTRVSNVLISDTQEREEALYGRSFTNLEGLNKRLKTNVPAYEDNSVEVQSSNPYESLTDEELEKEIKDRGG